MKKQLLYIGCPYLGENLFGTPCMELLSKEYDITLVTPRWTVLFFRQYPFIKNVIPSDGVRNTFVENVRLHMTSLQEISRIFSDQSNSYYISQHDTDVKMFRAYNMDYFIPIPVVPDEKLNQNISRTKKYLTKMNLLPLIDPATFDFSIRIPAYNKPIESNGDIVICQGSNDKLRRLTPQAMMNFSRVAPNAIFLVEKDIADLLDFNERKIKYIVTSSSDENNFKKVISLFQSKPKTVIGPDTGLINLALGYKIPVVWLESRLRIEAVVDHQYKNLVNVYRRKNVCCNQDCNARLFNKQIQGSDILEILPAPTENETPPPDLACRKHLFPSCVDYSMKEVEEIISIASK